VRELLTAPRGSVTAGGEIAGFAGRVMAGVFSGRVLRFFGETLRQAGILILGSALVIWGLAFILGLQCGIEGASSAGPRAPRRTPASSPPVATCAR
jgi:phospholipid/cholesterol/gamma-HCH transport system permease protein